MRPILFSAALVLANAAQADTTAIYGNAATKFSMTIKVASNGNIRAEVLGRDYYFVDGKDYFVDRKDNKVVVMRTEDLAAVMAEKLGRSGNAAFTPAPVILVAKGRASINKWSGEAYYVRGSNGQLSPTPMAVISNDPRLSLLGRAMERQYARSEMMMTKVIGRAPASNVDQVLHSGAPISFEGVDLRSVSFEPIPKDQFALPAQPVSIEDVRKSMAHR